jgi:outer membrane protein TolC
MHAALVDLSRELDVRDVAGAETLRQARKRLQSAAGSDVEILGAQRLPLLDATAKMQRAGSSIEALERVRRAPGGTPGD